MDAEILLLAVGSMFWPLLLMVDVIAFKTNRPVAILSGFLAGGLITTVGIGCAIVFSVEDTSLVTGYRHTTDAAVDITLGMVALVVGVVIRRGRGRRAVTSAIDRPGRVERLVARGVPLAFVAGIVANVFPGAFPFIGMKNIAELDLSTASTVLTVIGFYLVMFTFVEAPIVGFLVAPRRTAAAVSSFNAWLSANLRTLASWVLVIVGLVEIVRGVVAATGS